MSSLRESEEIIRVVRGDWDPLQVILLLAFKKRELTQNDVARVSLRPRVLNVGVSIIRRCPGFNRTSQVEH